MTYALLNLLVLLTIVVIAAWPLRNVAPRSFWLTMLVLIAMTALFDNLIILSGTVAYDSQKISGMLIGAAPIEDFAYTVAAVILVPTLWGLFSKQRDSKENK
jgi:lycopene cyclase domain-containing protein